MMNNESSGQAGATPSNGYPLHRTAATLNERLGLYLSPEQERGLATGLLIGVTLAGALIAWNVGSALRGRW